MSISNLQQIKHYRQETIYNYVMSIYDAKRFADWLNDAYKGSPFKSYADLAAAAKLTRSAVSSLATAKLQPLTGKPSQPKPETVVKLAEALNKDADEALLLAGYAPRGKDMESHEIIKGVRLQLDHSVKLNETDKQRIIDVVKMLATGAVTTATTNEEK